MTRAQARHFMTEPARLLKYFFLKDLIYVFERERERERERVHEPREGQEEREKQTPR